MSCNDIEIVTSFSPAGRTLYGQMFMDTFRKFWPACYRLVVYYERDRPRHPGLDISKPQVEFRDLFENQEMIQFLNENCTLETRGAKPMPGHVWPAKALKAGYNFRFDAYKFARKAFAIHDALQKTDAKILVWVDADTTTFAKVPIDLAARTLPDTCDIARLYRGKTYHSECGYIALRVSTDTKKFYEYFKNLYLSGNYKNLKEFHDSWVFDYLINLTPELKIHNIPHMSNSHPFINSVLGDYMDHLKGDKRKIAGKSFPQDRIECKK